VYQTYNALENHTLGGKCELREERTLLDRAKLIYHAKLAEGTDIISTECESSQSTRDPPVKGWALKTTKSSKRFSEAQRSFLDRKFNIGQETGHKLNPASVAKDMRYAKKLDGTRLFQADEFLTATQVQSYFSRLTAKSRQQRLEVDFTVEAYGQQTPLKCLGYFQATLRSGINCIDSKVYVIDGDAEAIFRFVVLRTCRFY
jgi:hypothetical protein